MQTAANLELRGIASGFGYLHRAAGFEISRGPVAYSSRDTYARALGVGLVNTLRVSLLGDRDRDGARSVDRRRPAVEHLDRLHAVDGVRRGDAQHAAAAAAAVLVRRVSGAPGSPARAEPPPGRLPVLPRPLPASPRGTPGVRRLRLSRRHVDLAGVRGAAHRLVDLYRGVHRRDRPGRDPRRRQRPDRGRGGARDSPAASASGSSSFRRRCG